jgi:hypothetical protein
VGGDDGRGHKLRAQRPRFRRVCHPPGDELPEQPLVAGHAGNLPVTEGGFGAGDGVPAAGDVALIEIVQQHQADGVGDRGQGGALIGSLQAFLDLPEQPVVIGEDDVFLRAVVPEKRGPAKTRPLGDVIDGGLLVPALVEQRERGLRESALHALARRLRQARLHEYISWLAGDDVDQPGPAVLYVLNGEQELHGPEASLRITDAGPAA